MHALGRSRFFSASVSFYLSSWNLKKAYALEQCEFLLSLVVYANSCRREGNRSANPCLQTCPENAKEDMGTQCKDWVDLIEKCFRRCKLCICVCVCVFILCSTKGHFKRYH